MLSELVHVPVVLTSALAPLNVGLRARSFVLIDQTPDGLFSIVELIQGVLEQPGLSEVLHVGISLLQLLELLPKSFEDFPHRCVVGQHHAGDLVVRGHVRRFLSEGHLDGGGTPRDEVAQFTLADSLQRFMNLSRVHLSLYNVQNTDVSSILDTDIC